MIAHETDGVGIIAATLASSPLAARADEAPMASPPLNLKTEQGSDFFTFFHLARPASRRTRPRPRGTPSARAAPPFTTWSNSTSLPARTA